jgi:hypothetical protein
VGQRFAVIVLGAVILSTGSAQGVWSGVILSARSRTEGLGPIIIAGAVVLSTRRRLWGRGFVVVGTG